MTWEYLQEKQFEARNKIVASFLENRTIGKIIVDLNCGTAKTVQFLSNDFKEYIGNDREKEYIDTANGYDIPNAKFYLLNDEDFYDVIELKNKPDILLLLGHGAGEFVDTPHESKTLTKTFLKMILVYKPEFIVLEAVQKFEQEFGLLSSIANEVLQMGYRIDYEMLLGIPPFNSEFGRRKFLFFSKI